MHGVVLDDDDYGDSIIKRSLAQTKGAKATQPTLSGCLMVALASDFEKAFLS